MYSANSLAGNHAMKSKLRKSRRDWHSALIGCRDFLVHPEWAHGFGGPFNGQQGRKAIFANLLSDIAFTVIIETGTYRGTTTAYMQSVSGLPVYSSEVHGRPFAYAFLRFLGNLHIRVFWNDSRAILKNLSRLESLKDARPFLYLDAHWNEDCPLAEEINLAFATWPQSVVMVDDFKVPNDEGYGFDSYGPGRSLALDYLGRELRLEAAAFFPALPSSQETGSRRGCVVLANDGEIVARLGRCATLSAPHRLAGNSLGGATGQSAADSNQLVG